MNTKPKIHYRVSDSAQAFLCGGKRFYTRRGRHYGRPSVTAGEWKDVSVENRCSHCGSAMTKRGDIVTLIAAAMKTE